MVMATNDPFHCFVYQSNVNHVSRTQVAVATKYVAVLEALKCSSELMLTLRSG